MEGMEAWSKDLLDVVGKLRDNKKSAVNRRVSEGVCMISLVELLDGIERRHAATILGWKELNLGLECQGSAVNESMG